MSYIPFQCIFSNMSVRLLLNIGYIENFKKQIAVIIM